VGEQGGHLGHREYEDEVPEELDRARATLHRAQYREGRIASGRSPGTGAGVSAGAEHSTAATEAPARAAVVRRRAGDRVPAGAGEADGRRRRARRRNHGLLVAYALNRAGARVAVLEARSVGSGATGIRARSSPPARLAYDGLVAARRRERAAAPPRLTSTGSPSSRDRAVARSGLRPPKARQLHVCARSRRCRGVRARGRDRPRPRAGREFTMEVPLPLNVAGRREGSQPGGVPSPRSSSWDWPRGYRRTGVRSTSRAGR